MTAPSTRACDWTTGPVLPVAVTVCGLALLLVALAVEARAPERTHDLSPAVRPSSSTGASSSPLLEAAGGPR